MRKERKHYTAEEKVAILRRHLLDKVPVSDLFNELGLQPTVFYRSFKSLYRKRANTPRSCTTLASPGFRYNTRTSGPFREIHVYE